MFRSLSPSKAKISTKISIGFGVVLVLHVTIAVMNHVGLNRGSHNFDDYRRMNLDALGVLEIDQNVSQLQRNVLMFTYTGHSGPAHRVRQLHGELTEQLKTTANLVENEDDRASLERMAEHVETYMEQFEAVIVDRERRRHLSDEVMARLSQQASAGLRRIIDESIATGDTEIAALAGVAHQDLLLAEATASRYRDSPDSTFVTETKRHLAESEAGIHRFLDHVRDPDHRVLADETLALLPQYEEAFLQMVQATRGYLHLVNVVMAGEAAEFARGADEFKTASLRNVDTLAGSMSEDAERFQALSNVVSILTIVIGIVAAWLIGRTIVPPLRAVTETLVRLARGEHDAEVPGLQREDEVGQMATAAQVFREKARETEVLLVESRRLVDERNAVNRRLKLEITERRQAEEELKLATEHLQRSNAELEQFVYTASHDLKSPIVTIQGFIGHLRGDAAAGRGDRVDHFISRIEKAAGRMLDNVEDLLELSRIGRVESETGPVDVGRVVHSLIEEHHTEINRLGVAVTVDDLPTIVGDRVRITQIFDNLLVNSLKYGCTGDGSELHFGAEESTDEVCFFVRDNGPGIAPEYQEKIFALFQRLSSADDGTGIGLTIVKRCAEIHGGRVWVESAPGRGATFRIILPRTPRDLDAADGCDEMAAETEVTA